MSIREMTHSHASTVPIDNTTTAAEKRAAPSTVSASPPTSPAQRPRQRIVKVLRHLVPSKETLSKDLAMVGYGMAFSPVPVHFSYADSHRMRNDRNEEY